MAKTDTDENTTLDKKAARRAEKMRKKEEKKNRKSKKDAKNPEEETGKAAVIGVTAAIVLIWIGIFVLLIKLDVGGFGSTVLSPVLKDVPYLSRILPETTEEDEALDVQYPYATVEDAVKRIKELELELDEALKSSDGESKKITQLQAEVERLKEFETQQVEFQELKTQFYQEVVFAENAPDVEEYKSYYESIDAANAAELYKQVVQQVQKDEELSEYAKTYAEMKPKQAAAIMEEMTDNLALVAEILEYMDAESRGDILGAMDSKVAAQVTKLMEPQ